MAFPDVSPPTDLPSPPFLIIPGIANFRDIGGYPCSSNKLPSHHESIRRNLVYRCADPSKIKLEGLTKINDLGVKKIFDLRSEKEIKREGPMWEGVGAEKEVFVTRGPGDKKGEQEEVEEGKIERIWCPVFAQRDYGPESVALRYRQYARNGSEGFVQAYKDVLANAGEAYNIILSHLAQHDPQPCIVHCTAGKDRTGVLVALLYLLCQVPTRVIAREYSLTDQGLEHLRPLMVERLLRHPAMEGDETRVRNMISSKSENMLATIDMITQEYGSAEGYVRTVVGLSDEQIARLKGNLTVVEPPILDRE